VLSEVAFTLCTAATLEDTALDRARVSHSLAYTCIIR